MGRQRIKAKNSWFIPGLSYVGEAEGEFIAGKNLSLEFALDGKDYSVTMAAEPDGEWQGSYQCGISSAFLSAKFYSDGGSSFVLVGRWREAGFDFIWLVHDVVLDDAVEDA
jgi:hypothetical protein